MARLLSFAILVLVTGAFGVLFFEVISVFLLPLFLATVVAIIFRPLHDLLLRLCGGRRYAAAMLTTSAVLLAVLLPSLTVFGLGVSEATRLVRGLDEGEFKDKLERARVSLGLDYPFAAEFRFVDRSLVRLLTDAREGTAATGNHQALVSLCEEWNRLLYALSDNRHSPPLASAQAVTAAMDSAREKTPGTLDYQQALEDASRRFRDFQVELLGGTWSAALREVANPSAEDVRNWTSQLFSITPDRLSAFGSRAGIIMARGLFGILVFLVATVCFFADGPQIVRSLMALSPLEDRYVEQLIAEFTRVSRAVVSGALAAAFAQALLAGVAFRLAGLESVFLLTAITAVTAMVPFVGASFVWLPAGLWLIFIDQRALAGTMVLIFGFSVISTIDNIIKPWVLHGQSSMHPLAALIGVLGGVQAMGPLGVFVGPMVVAFLQTLLSLLHRELGSFTAVRKSPVLPGSEG